jgi:predicted 2-oxoglutarate/Fe(II)-dependent dioxygenase YbiX
MYPDEIVAGCINIYENAWPNPEETIKEIENEIKNNDDFFWTRAETIEEGVQQNYRTNSHLGISHFAEDYDNILAKNIHNQFYFLLLSTSIPYAKKYKIGNMFHEGYNLLKYSGGQEYKAHFDGGTETGRTISAILYLNNDYEGGQIEFVNFGLKIKPEPGMFILFPSNYAYSHIAHPVTDGTKYAIVTWIKDRQL